MTADLAAIARRYAVAQRAKTDKAPPFRAALIESSWRDIPDLLAEIARLEQLLSGVRDETVALVADMQAISQGLA